jgi:site-specific DNA recombinase
MGRLTLNVLLSFAQFEREVTSERIRDKIAASKRKGLWVGGMSPLDYDAKDRKTRSMPPKLSEFERSDSGVSQPSESVIT